MWVACPWLGKESEFIYKYSTCSERGRTRKRAKRGMVCKVFDSEHKGDKDAKVFQGKRGIRTHKNVP